MLRIAAAKFEIAAFAKHFKSVGGRVECGLAKKTNLACRLFMRETVLKQLKEVMKAGGSSTV